MAQLKDLLVTGASRLIGDVYTNKIQITVLNAPTSSGGTTYGAGTNGQVLKSNGTSVYWAADSNSDVNVTQTITTTSAAYRLLFSNTADDTTRTETARKAAALYYNPATKLLTVSGGQVTATTFNGWLNGTATTATQATHAATANSATTASQATHAATANTATTATEATHAATANSATTASQATHAATANSATTASNATTAGWAVTASRATTAGNATDATKVAKAGDTMTGLLTLSGAPTADLHAATKKYVDDSLSSMAGPMRFMGTLGTGGTTTTLAAAAAGNKGYSYKVITNGTYQSVEAKIGDMLVSNGSAWVLIPSGDEPSGTVTNVATGSGLTGGPITTSGTISHAVPSGAASGAKGSSTARYYIKTITTDAFGHVTAVTTGNETVTNTDEKVKQLADTTANTAFPVILAYGTSTAAVTNNVNKTNVFTYNPSTYSLKINNATIQYNNTTGCLEIAV